MDDLVKRYRTRDDVFSVQKNVLYNKGEMDLYVVYNDGRRMYIEYKLSDSQQGRRKARSQLYRALKAGVCDIGVYVSHREGALVAKRYRL